MGLVQKMDEVFEEFSEAETNALTARGWEYHQIDEDDWMWLKYVDDNCVAEEDDAVWVADLAAIQKMLAKS
jgi:hypothetical protein